MKKLFVLLGVTLLASVTEAAVGVGENLILNGTFESEQVDFPEFWSAGSTKNIVFLRTGGPEGKKAAVSLTSDGSVSGTVSVRQQGMTLVAGGSYKLSAYIKTKGFKSRSGGLIIHNAGWVNAVGISALPSDSDWRLHEKTFTLFPSKDKTYGVAMYASGLTGEVYFADVKLEAISEDARKGSRSQFGITRTPRLVPVEPLLNRIPFANPELTFKFFGALPEKMDMYECAVTVGENRISPKTFPLQSGKMPVKLDGLSCGDYSLQAVVRHRQTRASVLDVTYPITVINIPDIDRSSIKPLNNLVSELLNQSIANPEKPQTFRFVTPRGGWVFVAVTGASPSNGLRTENGISTCSHAAPPACENDSVTSRQRGDGAPRLQRVPSVLSNDLKVVLDDRDTVITAATDRLEAFREIGVGQHRLTVSGVSKGARVIVRSIPEIFDYPPCANSQVKENGSYDWTFMKQHILHAVTTLNGGGLPGNALTEAKARGLKWLANFNVAPVDDPIGLRERMEKHAGMTQPQYDGFTSDELFFGRPTIENYTQAQWRLRNPENRLIYTWIVGKPEIPSIHTDFMSACLNASKGRGRLLYEAYCRPQPDEKAAAAYLDNMLGETMRRFNAFFPNAAAGTGIIFGNFNQIPIISLELDPSVDFKYFLDMQVNLIANSPDFKGLATTGYWGTYYGDEELARWSFKLMRHYAVEGNKEMLSARYGFACNPGLLRNPDFKNGLEGWSLSPAADGSIRADTIAGYGKNSQGRWGASAAGDTVCVMTRQAALANRISQTATGLTVGKAYCLQFVTADRKDVIGKKHNPRQYGIDVELPGVERIAGRSFVHIDKRQKKRDRKDPNLGKINLHRIVFRATSPTQAITFHDAKAAPGEELIINFIQLKLYLE